MKKLLLILFFLPIMTLAQQTYVPDDNFEAWIETTYPAADNGAINDNYVMTAGLDFPSNNSNGYVYITQATTSGPIFDLTGIEDFIARTITIQNLLITQLDLTDLKFGSNGNGSNPYQMHISSNQYLEKLILPDSDDTLSLNIDNNDSLSDIVFQSDLSYNNISITDQNNLCELNFKGKFLTINNSFSVNIARCYNIVTIDFSGITEAAYQSHIIIQNLWIYDVSFTNPLASNLQQINFNGTVSIYNWKFVGDFGNLTGLPPHYYYNYTPCIEVPSSSDASYCTGSNEWPDSATYSTNCYTPTSCQVATSIIEVISDTRELIKTIDILGRKTKGSKNEVLFYIYNDGTVEKKIIIE